MYSLTQPIDDKDVSLFPELTGQLAWCKVYLYMVHFLNLFLIQNHLLNYRQQSNTIEPFKHKK